MEAQITASDQSTTEVRRQRMNSSNDHTRRVALWCVPLAALMVLGGCTTTQRAAELVVDHHIGMVRGAVDIMSGEAEAREQRVAKLRAELAASQTALAAEQDQGRLIELLRQHVALQDALVVELVQGHGPHLAGHQHADNGAHEGESRKQ